MAWQMAIFDLGPHNPAHNSAVHLVKSGGSLTFAHPCVIASHVYADDHHRSSDLVLALSAGDGLVTDGAGYTGAGAPYNVIIGQWPQRAVNNSLPDAGEEVHAHFSGSSGTPCAFSSEGKPGV